MSRETLAPAHPVMIAIAVVVTAGSIWNAVSAVSTDEVWLIGGRGFSIKRVAHASDPLSFWVILLAPPALAAYFAWDIWRRPRRKT